MVENIIEEPIILPNGIPLFFFLLSNPINSFNVLKGWTALLAISLAFCIVFPTFLKPFEILLILEPKLPSPFSIRLNLPPCAVALLRASADWSISSEFTSAFTDSFISFLYRLEYSSSNIILRSVLSNSRSPSDNP